MRARHKSVAETMTIEGYILEIGKAKLIALEDWLDVACEGEINVRFRVRQTEKSSNKINAKRGRISLVTERLGSLRYADFEILP